MRIAHISDLHALDLRGVSPLRFFNKRFLGWINLLRKRASQHSLRILDALCQDLNRLELDHIVVGRGRRSIRCGSARARSL
jgi:3',5'-cyclic AMP phosphodiesterase CpdA